MMSSASETNVGSGTVSSIPNMTLVVDTSTCTFRFDWEWAVDATLTISGSSIPLTPENAGALQSVARPLGAWSSGIAYSSAFPTYGMIGRHRSRSGLLRARDPARLLPVRRQRVGFHGHGERCVHRQPGRTRPLDTGTRYTKCNP